MEILQTISNSLKTLNNRIKKIIFLLNGLSKNDKIILFLNSFLLIFGIEIQLYLIIFHNNLLSIGMIILMALSFTSYFFIFISYLFKTTKLTAIRQDLEQEQNYNKTLKLLYDDVRTFRHDFGNIVQSISGYIDTNNMCGLQKYYRQLQVDFEDVKSLETLNPTIIDEPAVYSIFTAKYHTATNLGISMKIHVSIKLKNLNMKIYEFSRILGILLDNAIEACENCDEKIINVEIRKDEKCPRQLLLIQNTYSNKSINLNRLREKGYTSKKDDGKPHGLGLWEVDRILKKAKNLNLFSTNDSIFFTQQLEMYDE